jgi:DNA-binding XRE family transcriptional regulator
MLRRHEKQISKQSVSHLADIHQTCLHGIESGKRCPSVGVPERFT